jgi:hypothetical protein
VIRGEVTEGGGRGMDRPQARGDKEIQQVWEAGGICKPVGGRGSRNEVNIVGVEETVQEAATLQPKRGCMQLRLEVGEELGFYKGFIWGAINCRHG